MLKGRSLSIVPPRNRIRTRIASAKRPVAIAASRVQRSRAVLSSEGAGGDAARPLLFLADRCALFPLLRVSIGSGPLRRAAARCRAGAPLPGDAPSAHKKRAGRMARPRGSASEGPRRCGPVETGFYGQAPLLLRMRGPAVALPAGPSPVPFPAVTRYHQVVPIGGDVEKPPMDSDPVAPSSHESTPPLSRFGSDAPSPR